MLVEKPVCPTAAEAQQLVDLANEKKLILSVYQNRRWDIDFLTVKKLLEDGTVSQVSPFTSTPLLGQIYCSPDRPFPTWSCSSR